jgi:hypothetical protein
LARFAIQVCSGQSPHALLGRRFRALGILKKSIENEHLTELVERESHRKQNVRPVENSHGKNDATKQSVSCAATLPESPTERRAHAP